MSSSPVLPAVLTRRQQIHRQKLDDDMAKALIRAPSSAADMYAHQVATSGDWLIELQGQRSLPLALCQMIPMPLRDKGLALIEDTREINNEFVGVSFRTAEVILAVDPVLLALHSEITDWGMAVAREVAFKLRHQAKSDPVRAFLSAYDGFICAVDDNIAHCPASVFPFAWSTLVDVLVVQLFDQLLLRPGHCKVVHDKTGKNQPYMSFSALAMRATNIEQLERVFSVFAIEPYVYLQKVFLEPLLAALRADASLPTPDRCRLLYEQMFSDLLEAAPYLMSSDRAERFMFSVPGTTAVATITFLSAHGCARFAIGDDEIGLAKGLHSNFYRAALNIGYDSLISSWGHRGRTLAEAFGAEAGHLLSYWLLKQVHERMLNDYLSIANYYLQGAQKGRSDDENAEDEQGALAYVAWAKASDANTDQHENADNDGATNGEMFNVSPTQGTLPHLRRRYFFKLLERCGAQIEQGKGSEIKLLRKTKRPFRLGNHYGSNPTIPAFLAAEILKRLEITEQEWLTALNQH